MSEFLKKYEIAIKNCLLVPNHLLPKSYHDNKTTDKAVSLATLERKVQKKEEKAEKKMAKIERQRKIREEKNVNLASYEKQAEGVHADSFIELEHPIIDENRLYHNQLKFVSKMVNACRYDPSIVMNEHLED